MPKVADPKETQQLIKGADRLLTRMLLKALHPGALAVAEQLKPILPHRNRPNPLPALGWTAISDLTPVATG
jgi:hypothetical protein